MTAEQMHITTNKFSAILSHLTCSMADLVSKNGSFQPVFRTIALKWMITSVPTKCLQ